VFEDNGTGEVEVGNGMKLRSVKSIAVGEEKREVLIHDALALVFVSETVGEAFLVLLRVESAERWCLDFEGGSSYGRVEVDCDRCVLWTGGIAGERRPARFAVMVVGSKAYYLHEAEFNLVFRDICHNRTKLILTRLVM
jgi:hypothetical protein